jgi:hypothetical protein
MTAQERPPTEEHKMSLIAVIGTIVGLDVLVLALLAFVMGMPFRGSRSRMRRAASSGA